VGMERTPLRSSNADHAGQPLMGMSLHRLSW